MFTEPMMTPMMTQLTPTPIAPRAPSVTACRMLCGVMRVSFRSQETGIVIKRARIAA